MGAAESGAAKEDVGAAHSELLQLWRATAAVTGRPEGMASSGALPLVVAAMTARPGSAEVAANGCRALSTLAADPAGRAEVLSKGALPLVYAAMRRHPGAAEVQAYGLGVLLNVAADPARARRHGGRGGAAHCGGHAPVPGRARHRDARRVGGAQPRGCGGLTARGLRLG